MVLQRGNQAIRRDLVDARPRAAERILFANRTLRGHPAGALDVEFYLAKFETSSQ